jgi:hypothetical protein
MEELLLCVIAKEGHPKYLERLDNDCVLILCSWCMRACVLWSCSSFCVSKYRGRTNAQGRTRYPSACMHWLSDERLRRPDILMMETMRWYGWGVCWLGAARRAFERGGAHAKPAVRATPAYKMVLKLRVRVAGPQVGAAHNREEEHPTVDDGDWGTRSYHLTQCAGAVSVRRQLQLCMKLQATWDI